MTIFMCFLVLRYYREVLPGEIVQISRHGIKTLSVVPRPEGDLPAFCIFEYVYFARPDSIFEGLNNEYWSTFGILFFFIYFVFMNNWHAFSRWLYCMFSIVSLCAAGQMVYTVRQRCGRQLAIEAPTDADVVSTVPESATPAALGYAQQVSLQAVCSNSVMKCCNILTSRWVSLVLLILSIHSLGCLISKFCVRTAMLGERSSNQILA